MYALNFPYIVIFDIYFHISTDPNIAPTEERARRSQPNLRRAARDGPAHGWRHRPLAREKDDPSGGIRCLDDCMDASLPGQDQPRDQKGHRQAHRKR